ncbi:hypothetical protein GF367_03730 [Candidatus Woesearchaeota archaeon]|nr:hypothetical protein [Candidatus Woesearchaeota archaeon]
MVAKKPVLKQKVKKKKWFRINAPALFGGQLIGESYVESAEHLKGKFISTNLSTITNDMKKQNVLIKLRVNKVAEGIGQTEIIGLYLVQGLIKRLVRRGRTKIEDSFTAKTKDGHLVRTKPMLITTSTCVASTASQLRMTTKKLLKEQLAKTGFVNMIRDVLSFKLQKTIKESLNKIHPVRSVDIRAFAREAVRGKVPDAELELIPEEAAEEEKAAAAEESEDETTEEPEEKAKKATLRKKE